MPSKLSVTHSLKGKSILVTGSTGFVGKALLEKLLRSVPDINRIVLLIRGNKKHPDASARFWDEIYTSSIFDHHKANNENELKVLCESKIKVVTGEITEDLFGLSEASYLALAAEVDLVINSAASVNFREPIDDALKINTLCLSRLVRFLEDAGNIPLVHVSTCYVNGLNRGVQEECSVVPGRKPVLRDEAGDYKIEKLAAKLLKKADRIRASYSEAEAQEKLIHYGIKCANKFGWNDTYTFTKWMGEQLLIKSMKEGSLTILRPSIVESALEAPIEGWIEGVKVADALILAYARRRFSLFPARKAGVVDIIPVDMVVNSIILSAAERLSEIEGLRIYQCCSSEQNPITIASYMSLVMEALRHNWMNYPKLTKNRPPRKKLKAVTRSAFLAMMKSLHALARTRYRLSRKNVRLGEQLKSLDVALALSTIYSFYTNPRYTFSNKELLGLFEGVDVSEKAEFCVDASTIDWNKYLTDVHLPGLEKYGMTH